MLRFVPVSTHNYRINDYASYRGMLVLTGVTPEDGKEIRMLSFPMDGKLLLGGCMTCGLWVNRSVKVARGRIRM